MEQSDYSTDQPRPNWARCKHTTVVKKRKSLRSGGAFDVWRCKDCNIEFVPKGNRQ